MNLEYKILWFDDQPEEVASYADGIKDRMSRKGFKVDVKWVDRTKDLNKLLSDLRRRSDIDMILMDWNMGEGQDDGAVLAKRVRRHVYTDILFYSSEKKPKLIKAIYEQGIDGVFCCSREDVVVQAMHVIDTTIKKVLDVNHLRGLVLGAVSGYEAEIQEILEFSLSKLDGEGVFVDEIKENLIKQIESNKRSVSKLSKDNVKEVLSNRSFSAFHQYQALCKLLNKVSDEEETMARLHDLLLKYENDVIVPRNALAHAKAYQVGGEIKFKDRKITFGEDELNVFRTKLLMHGENLDDVRSSLTSFIDRDAKE